MTWIIRVPDGPVIESDDFTLDDLDKIEKETGVYWSIMNPLAEVKVARAFLKAAYRRADRDPDDVDTLTMKTFKSMFDFRKDEEPEEAPPLGRKVPKDRMRKSSSGGAPTGSNGPPQSQEPSGSVTSLVS